MAQFSKRKGQLSSNNNDLYEVTFTSGDVGTFFPNGNLNPTTDSFGRLRTSQSLTLFDSFTRYEDKEKFFDVLSGSATSIADSASVELTVPATSGEYAYRESKRVFSYQPGKSLLHMASFTLEAPKTNLRQRVGYFGVDNGIFLELDNDVASFAIRNKGQDTKISQTSWSIDKLDGTGPSGFDIDLTKSQIFFTDIEWLGVGSVRFGFIINGQFVVCHIENHTNNITEPYMVTACLPVRYEIENTGTTSGASTLKAICNTVISEAGYSLKGQPRSASLNLGEEKDLTSADTYYPIIAIRLKDTHRDGIVIPTGVHLHGIAAGGAAVVHYRIVKNATVTGGSWVSVGTNSNVVYNKTATSYTGGTIISNGFIGMTNQSSGTLELKSEDLFKYQLERNFDSCETFLVVAGSSGAGDDVIAAIDWEEIT